MVRRLLFSVSKKLVLNSQLLSYRLRIFFIIMHGPKGEKITTFFLYKASEVTVPDIVAAVLQLSIFHKQDALMIKS